MFTAKLWQVGTHGPFLQHVCEFSIRTASSAPYQSFALNVSKLNEVVPCPYTASLYRFIAYQLVQDGGFAPGRSRRYAHVCLDGFCQAYKIPLYSKLFGATFVRGNRPPKI